jgi:steroid delta-isomerase-like uncharacterized protein
MTLSPKEVAIKKTELGNAGDFDGFQALFADDAYELEVATGHRTVGAADVVAAARGFKASFTDLHAAINNVWSDEKTAVLELTFTGTHTELLEWGDGVLAPTGRKLDYRVLEVLEVEDGKIKGQRMYYDTTTVAEQLGVSGA